MNDKQLLRYNSSIMLSEIDFEGQQKLLNSHVAIIGCGGLGSPAALYLAATGIGKITLVDFDHVELTNLQRQIAHKTSSIKQLKTQSCKQSCLDLNPEISINTVEEKLTIDTLAQLLEGVDVVLDATDNFESRFGINKASVKTKTPLVSGAAIRFDAQLTVFRPDLENQPCYHCLYKEQGNEAQLCNENGVISPLVGIIGSMQALETIKILTNIGKSPVGILQLFDAKYSQWRSIKYKKDINCPVCKTP